MGFSVQLKSSKLTTSSSKIALTTCFYVIKHWLLEHQDREILLIVLLISYCYEFLETFIAMNYWNDDAMTFFYKKIKIIFFMAVIADSEKIAMNSPPVEWKRLNSKFPDCRSKKYSFSCLENINSTFKHARSGNNISFLFLDFDPFQISSKLDRHAR